MFILFAAHFIPLPGAAVPLSLPYKVRSCYRIPIFPSYNKMFHLRTSKCTGDSLALCGCASRLDGVSHTHRCNIPLYENKMGTQSYIIFFFHIISLIPSATNNTLKTTKEMSNAFSNHYLMVIIRVIQMY